jgi:hypothetical protein
MFAMCSATDSFDIAPQLMVLIFVKPMFDGDLEGNYQSKMNYSNSFAFKDYIERRQ